MNRLNYLRYVLIGPDATDADESRRDYMTRVVFAMMGGTLAVFTLVITFGWGAGVFDFEGVAIALSIDMSIAAGWWLARHEHWRLAQYIPVAVTFGLGLYGTFYVGLVTTLVLFYVLAILLAAMLLGSRAQWMVLELSILTHLAVGWSHTPQPFSNMLQVAIVVSGCFTGIALLQWLSTNQLKHALASARATAVELQTEITEHKWAEVALRESEDKYRRLFELESDAIVLVDNTTGQIMEANAAASALYGYSREEWLAKKNTDISTQPDETRRVMVEGETRVPIRYHRKKDGGVFPVEITISHFMWHGGPMHIAAIRDITRRKQAEEALRESERKLRLSERHLRATLDHAPIGIATADRNGKFLEVNREFARMLNYSQEELCHMTLLDITPPGDIEKSRANAQALWNGDISSFQMEKKYQRKDGTAIDGFLNATLVYDEGKQPLFGVAMVNDITERLRIERELADTKVLLQSALEQTPVPMVLISAPGGIVRVINSACFESLGVEAEPSPRGHSIDTFDQIKWPDFESEGEPLSWAELPLVLALQGITTKGKEIVAVMKDGTRRWKMVSAGPIYNDVGELIASFAVFPDITERKEAEEALQVERTLLAQRVEERTAELKAANVELGRAVRLKDEFLANMSHELRTPLNAILGLSEALQELVYGPLNDKQRMTLHTIEESGHHLLSLINDILDLSKIGANKLELQVGWTSVESVCQASLAFIKQAAHKKRIKISYTSDSAVTVIQADERRLKQILVNLLSNAVKFTPEGGAIGLEMAGDADQQLLHLTVWDTGIGIKHEDIKRLFQPFVQLDAGLARQYSGTGLGLALVQRLVEMHGGSIQVESETSKGSRFTISLPWREPRESDMATLQRNITASPAPLVSSPSCPVKVLIVEDNEEGLDALIEYLAARGYTVSAARNGGEAILQARVERPAVIVMDIQMPGMDGLEAIRCIRADADLWAISIIALTALAMPGDRERCLEAGANEYLSKPVSMKELVTAIEAQLQRAGAQTTNRVA